MSHPAFLSPSLCRAAWELVKPSVDHAMTDGSFNRFEGIGVVLDPTKRFEPKYDRGPRDERFIREVPLFAWTIGNPVDWEHPYHSVALAKAWASFKYRLPARQVQQNHPYLFELDMTKWGGSAIDPDSGLVVAFSGVQQHYDELISKWVLAAIQALSIDSMQDVMRSELTFFEEDDARLYATDYAGDDPSGLIQLRDLFGIPEPAADPA